MGSSLFFGALQKQGEMGLAHVNQEMVGGSAFRASSSEFKYRCS